MNDHQPTNNFLWDSDAEEAPAINDGDAPQAAETDLLEPDFSRLRMARAHLDGAFPQE